MKKKYIQLSIVNLILTVIAICLYLPYTLEAFNMAGFEWFDFVSKMLKDNYFEVLVGFGIFLLLWLMILNIFSIFSNANLPKVMFKLSAIMALILPLIYVLALKNDWALKFWIKNINSNIKMIAYTFIIVSWGSFILGLIYNFTKRNRANLHHILQALFMCGLLTLLIICNGWCGWDIDLTSKIYGIMVGWLAIYLPISSIVLIACSKKRY